MAEATTPAPATGPATKRGPVLTDKPERFVKSLRAGDVLLFDSLHLLSNLVKVSENRPVSHAAVYLGDDVMAHVVRHTPDPDPHKPPLVPAARTEKLSTRLSAPEGWADRTVTAMRHRDITKASAAGVVDVARSYTDPKLTLYDYGSLFVLMMPSLMRSYGDGNAGDGLSAAVTGTVRAIAESIAAAFANADEKGGGHGPKLNCSEFVYRCFVQADPKVSIEITQPIGLWEHPEALREPPANGSGGGQRSPDGGDPSHGPHDVPPGSGIDGGGGNWIVGGGGGEQFALQGLPISEDGGRASLEDVSGWETVTWDGPSQVVDGEGLVTFGDTFRSGILGAEAPVGTSFRMAGSGWDLAAAAGLSIMDQLHWNHDMGKYRGDPTVAAGSLYSDAVTPRDLWDSPSLSPVAVLHRPAEAPGPRQ